MRRARLVPAALLSTLLLSGFLTACGGDEEEPQADPTESTSEASAPEPEDEPEVWPLTGLEVANGESATQRHPVYVVKVENNSAAVPQRGLHEADLVVEELVEGNTTRLAAFFYSRMPEEVGPVRSMRASDIGIVPAADATVVTSGAAPVTIRRIQDAGIPFIGEGGAGTYREPSRSAPHNLFVNLAETAKKAKAKDFVPEPYLEWGTADDLPKGVPAKSLVADFGNQRTAWAWSKDGYEITNSYAGDQPYVADTVLALRVQIGDAGYKDPAGNFVPETKFTGSGPAVLFHHGRAIKATWKKADLRAPLTLETKKGALTVPAGHVFIELVPAENGDVTWTK